MNNISIIKKSISPIEINGFKLPSSWMMNLLIGKPNNGFYMSPMDITLTRWNGIDLRTNRFVQLDIFSDRVFIHGDDPVGSAKTFLGLYGGSTYCNGVPISIEKAWLNEWNSDLDEIIEGLSRPIHGP